MARTNRVELQEREKCHFKGGYFKYFIHFHLNVLKTNSKTDEKDKERRKDRRERERESKESRERERSKLI